MSLRSYEEGVGNGAGYGAIRTYPGRPDSTSRGGVNPPPDRVSRPPPALDGRWIHAVDRRWIQAEPNQYPHPGGPGTLPTGRGPPPTTQPQER
ncbi:hypothetical protein GCM10010441_46960 [Kitasatospora paracochleata]